MDQQVEALIGELLHDPANFVDPGAVLARIDHPSCRWASVNSALRDPARVPPRMPEQQPMKDMFGRWMIYSRGEKHLQLRRRFSGYFGPRQAESFRDTIEARLGVVLDDVAPRGEMDVFTDVAQRITLPLILDTMGIPSEDRAGLTELLEIFEEAIPRQGDPEWVAKGEAAVGRIMDIFEDYLAERRTHPQDDFLTDLVRTPLGDHEDWRDVAANCLFLLSNAFGNTPTLVAGTIGLLLDNPEVAAAMQRGELTLDQVTEEGARLLTPITYALSAGDTDDDEWETHYLAAANRDAQEFAAPDVFDPARVPNRHLTFLVGPHACLGASVAKLITGVVAEQTLQRLPGLRRSGPPTWSAAAPLHRLAHLPVAWDV